MRKLKKTDLDWRDLAVLSKFMNNEGKIMNKF
jgi:ribosomal protein S18